MMSPLVFLCLYDKENGQCHDSAARFNNVVILTSLHSLGGMSSQ